MPHDSADAMIHQVVFRWTGNQSGPGAGLAAVAQSCREREARTMADQLAPILRVHRGDRRSIVRTIWNDQAVLVRRSPKEDTQGRGSTVCHALISPTKLLTAGFCLGLGASPWGEEQWTQASGSLPAIRYEVLDAMANQTIPQLDAAVSSLARPLRCLVAQLLRTPAGRISAHTRGLDGTRADDSAETPDPALVALRGLCEVFGGTLGGEGWTYASYDTVDSHPLRVTFVPSWRASHEEDVRLRRIDLIKPGSDRAAILAEGLVRHYLDFIDAATSAGATKGRAQYRRPLEQLSGPLVEIEDEEERYDAVDRALRGLPHRAQANRTPAPSQQRAGRPPGRTQGPEGSASGGSPSGAAGAMSEGRPYDRDDERGAGPGRSAPTDHGGPEGGSAVGRGRRAAESGRGDAAMGGGESGAGSAGEASGTTAASAGSAGWLGTDTHPSTGSRRHDPGATAGPSNRAASPAYDGAVPRSTAPPATGQGASPPDSPSVRTSRSSAHSDPAPSNPHAGSAPSVRPGAGDPGAAGPGVSGHDPRGRTPTGGAPAVSASGSAPHGAGQPGSPPGGSTPAGSPARGSAALGPPANGSPSAGGPGSPGWTADSLVSGSPPPPGVPGRQHTTRPDPSSPANDPRPSSHPPAEQSEFRQYAPNPQPPAASLPAPPSGYDLAVTSEHPGSYTAPPSSYDPPTGTVEQPRAMPPKPKTPPPQSGSTPSHQSQLLHVDPGQLISLYEPFPLESGQLLGLSNPLKRGKRRTRSNVNASRFQQILRDLDGGTGGDHPAEDLKKKVQEDLKLLSDVDLLSLLDKPLSYEAQNLVLETLASFPRLEDELESLGELLLDRSLLLKIEPIGDALWEAHTDRVIRVGCWLFRALQKTLARDKLVERVGRALRQLVSSRYELPVAFIEALLLYAPPEEVPVLHNLVWRELMLGLHQRHRELPDEAQPDY